MPTQNLNLNEIVVLVNNQKYVYSELEAANGGYMTATTLGEKIRKIRKDKGLTLEELGRLTDSSKSYIWELENKNPPRPSAEKIAKIASVLGVTAEFLVDTEEATPDTDVVDNAFFRKYRKMDPSTKARIRQMVEVWGDDKK